MFNNRLQHTTGYGYHSSISEYVKSMVAQNAHRQHQSPFSEFFSSQKVDMRSLFVFVVFCHSRRRAKRGHTVLPPLKDNEVQMMEGSYCSCPSFSLLQTPILK
jgi:hypothetical protein